MRTNELEQALNWNVHTRGVSGGVFAQDEVQASIPKRKNVAFIINTDPSTESGEHWVVFYFTREEVYYFDSYGNPPEHKRFLKLIKKRKKASFFHKRVQGRGTMCGEYCLYFILAMQGHANMKVFGNELNFNDRYVRKYVHREFHC
jgi:hypothetical protein